MSQENVELVQASYAAFARGDLAYILDASDPDIEVVEPTELPDGSSYRGHQGLLDALDHWGGEWADIELEVERITGVGDRVVSLIHQRAQGRSSGAPGELRVAYVHTIKNGKCVRWEMFATWDQALEAVNVMKKGPPR
jgi:ketosteroid isomerase-like protein